MAYAAWPNADHVTVMRDQWDFSSDLVLSNPPQGDLGIICNTFMYSSDPEWWLKQISRSVPILLIQDLAVAFRGKETFCGNGPEDDGDCARYSISSYGVLGMTDPGLSVFDFSTCGYEILACAPYGYYD